MTKNSRRKIDAAQKAKVALKALRKQATESELAQQLRSPPQSNLRLEEAIALACGAGV